MALLILVGVVIFFVLVIWSIRRHRDPELRVECDASIDELIPSLAGLTLSTAVEGNRVEILENGAFFDVLLDEHRGGETLGALRDLPVEGRRAGQARGRCAVGSERARA